MPNPSDSFDPSQAKSPYDALLAAAPPESSPYDVLLKEAPEEKSPYDALLAAAPEEKSPVAVAAPASTSAAEPTREGKSLLSKSEEIAYPEFTGTLLSQKFAAPPSGLLQSALGKLSTEGLYSASGIADVAERESKGEALSGKPLYARDTGAYDDLKSQLNDVREENARTQEGGAAPDPREGAIVAKMRELEQPPKEDRASGKLATYAKSAFDFYGANPESQNLAAQLGRGAGSVGAMAPSMALGPAGLPAMAIQGASAAYAEAYDHAIQAGADDSTAQKAGSSAAVKTAPGLLAYLVGGKLAGEAGAALLKEASPIAKGIIGSALATGANVTIGSALRAMEGGDWRPTAESLTMDGLFGIMHGYGEWSGASEEVKQRAAAELVRRKSAFQDANPDVVQKVFTNILGDMDEETRLKTNALMARLNSGDELPKELQDLHKDIHQKLNAGIVTEMNASEAPGEQSAGQKALSTAKEVSSEPSPPPSTPITPQVIDGLVRSRNALQRANASLEDIADVTQQLSAFDPAEVTAAEERAKLPPAPKPPAGEVAPQAATGGPSKEDASAASFKQAETEKAAATLAQTAGAAAEVSPLAAAEAAKLAADVARKAAEPPTTKENATTQEQQPQGSNIEHQGVPQGTDVPANQNEVRKEDGGSPSGGGGAEPAAEVPTAEAKVAPEPDRQAARAKMLAEMTDLQDEPVAAKEPEKPPETDQPALRIVKAGKRFKIVNAADEQVGKRTYETEAHANRAISKIGKRSTFGLPASATGHDIIDTILSEIGKINLSGFSPEEQKQMFPYGGIWRNKLIDNVNGVAPDKVASSLAPSELDPNKVSHGRGDITEMFDLIKDAIGERGRQRDQRAAETQNLKTEEKRARSFERTALTPKEGETGIPVSDLKIGDEIVIDGEKVTVTKINADTGDVTMEDGSRWKTQKVEDGRIVYGEVTPVETDALSDWPDIETPEDAKTYADKNDLTDPAEPPVESSPESIAEQPPEAKGEGGATEPVAPGARTAAAPEKLVEKARRVLEAAKVKQKFAREEGDYELAASLARVIPKLERDLAALEKSGEAAPTKETPDEPVEMWQRTREQVGNQLAKHREAVKDAVARNKPVPDDVLAEYAGSKWADKEISRRAKAEKGLKPADQKQGLLKETRADRESKSAGFKDASDEADFNLRLDAADKKYAETVFKPGVEEPPKLAEGQDQGDLLSGGDINTGKTANVTNEAGGTLVRVGGQIVAKLSQNAKGEFVPELNDAGKKLTDEQKALIDYAATDYTKTWRAAKVREGASKPLAAADVTTQTDMLPGAPESDVPLFDTKPEAKPDKIRDALQRARDSLKDKPGELLADPFLIKTFGKPVLRTALDITIKAYDAGKAILEAVETGMDHLRKWAADNGQDFDEEKARGFFQPFIDAERGVTEEKEAPPAQAAPESPEGTTAPEKTSSSTEPTPPAEAAQGRVVALRKSFTDAQRGKMGLPAWDKPNALTNQEAWYEGQRVLAENPKAGEQLVAEMKRKPRPLDPYEKAILLHEEGVRDTEYHAAMDAVNKATNEQEHLSAQIRLDAALDANKEFYDVARETGRASGQSLQAHTIALDVETWTLARMEDAIQARKPFGEKLTKQERAQIADLHEQLKAERDRADKLEAEKKDFEVAKLLDKIAKDQRKQARSEASEVKASGGTYADWWNKREENAMDRIKARRGKLLSTIDPLNLAGLADEIIIGAAKVAKGLAKFPEWYASMKADLGDYFEPQAKAMFDESKKRATRDKRTFDEAPSKAPKPPKAEKTGEAPKAKGPKTTEEILKGIKEGAEAPEQKTIYDLVKSKIEANPDVNLDKAKVSEIMQEVRDDLAPHFPEITEDQVRDAFTGHGKITFPSKEQVNVKMRELRGAGDVISKIQEAARGEPVKRTGKQRDKPTQFQRDLTKELIRTMRENGVNTAPLESMLKTAHDARVTRLKNAIEDVQAQIAAGKRTPKTPGTPWTPEELALSHELGGLHEKLDALLDEPDSDVLNGLMNRIEAVTNKLNRGDIEVKRDFAVDTKDVSEARKKLEALNDELSTRRKALDESRNPPKTELERKIEALNKEEKKLTEQIRTGKIDQPTGTPTADVQPLGEAKNRVAALRKQIVEMRQAKRDALNPPKTEEEKTLAALEKRQRAAEVEIRDGKLETKTGRPTVDTEKVTKAKADLKDINRQLAEARKKSAEGIQRELDRYKKMIDGKRAELQRRIDTGDVSKPDRNKLSPEKTAIKKPLKILQEKWETMKRRQELKSQAPWQKALRWTTYLGHEMLLLAPAVGAKLTGAALTTAGFVRPIREIVGYGIGKALPFLGEKADVQIAPSMKSLFGHEMKAAAEAFMNIANDVGSTLKHGKSDFELEFGKDYSNEMVSYVGRFHGIFKTVPARQAFTATFLRLAEKYEKRGMDITDPDVRFSIGTQALFEAIRAKFQDPNMAVAALKSAMRTLDAKSPLHGAITKALVHTEMPVLTVASNISWSALEGIYGVPAGTARIAAKYMSNLAHNSFGKKGGNFVIRSMKDMSTEQADSIARQLKNGTVGAAAFLIGAYIYQNLGGVREEGQHVKEGDVKPGEIRPPEEVRDVIRETPVIGNPEGDIPKELVHHPMFTNMQMGATMMRVAEKIKNGEEKGKAEGFQSAMIAAAADSPIGQGVTNVHKLIDPATRLGAEGNLARTLLGLTGPMAWLAKKQDTDESTGEPTRRKAENLTDELKLAIPYLRQDVPEAKHHR